MAKSETIHTAARLTLIILAIVAIVAMVQLWSWTSADAQTSFTPYQQSVLDDGAVVLLTFDDDSLHNSAGTLAAQETMNATLTYGTDTASGDGSALVALFPGDSADHAFEIPDTPEARAALFGQTITIETLARFDGDVNDGDAQDNVTLAVIADANGGPSNAFELRVIDFGRVEGQVQDLTTTSGSAQVSTDRIVPSNTWVHLALTHEQIIEFTGPPGPNGPTPVVVGGVARIYLDGQQVGSVATSGNIDFPAGELPFALAGPSSLDRTGDYQLEPLTIDEYAIYPTALTAQQIQDHGDLIDGPIDPGVDDPLGIGGSTVDPFLVSDFDVSGTESSGGLTFDNCAVDVSDASMAACFALKAHLDAYLASAGLPSNAGTPDNNVAFDLLGYHRFTSSTWLAVVGSTCAGDLDVRGTFWELPVLDTFHGCPGIEYFGGDPAAPGVESGFSNGVDELQSVDLSFGLGIVRYLSQAVDREELVYVAFGDSFASGEGSDRFSSFAGSQYENGVNYPGATGGQENTLTMISPLPADGNLCHRSLINYAKLNSSLLDPGVETLLIDRTCSGAEIVPGGQPGIVLGNLSQVDQALARLEGEGLAGSDVDVVTVSMGGNDMGFSKLITACVASSYARLTVDSIGAFNDNVIAQLPPAARLLAQETSTAITSAVQADWATCEELDPLLADTEQGLEDLAEDLPAAHDRIALAFPEAEIYHVNYPVFLPEARDFPSVKCSLIDRRDSEYAAQVADELNGLIASAVHDSAGRFGGRFHLVDVSQSFGRNPLCADSAEDQFFNAVPDGVVGRIGSRILDPNTEPGIFLDNAVRADTLTACALAWVPDVVANVDCYSDDSIRLFAEWFGRPDSLEIIQAQLASVDATVSAEFFDAASFENFRGLFHPNAAGFQIFACEVLAEVTDTGECALPARQLVEPTINGEPMTGTSPISTLFDVPIEFDIPGFQPFDFVSVFFRSEPVPLGEFQVDGDGHLRVSLATPSDAVAGVHRMTFAGNGIGGEAQRFDVYVEIEGVPAPGQLLGAAIQLDPLERAIVTYLDTELGEVQADEFGTAFIEVIVPEYATVAPVNLVVTSESGVQIIESITAEDPPTGAVICNGLVATIVGTPGDDVLVGTPGDDVIAGLAGDDSIDGNGGSDTICGDDGNDEIVGNEGADLIFGGAGNDIIGAGKGDDVVFGGPGDDMIDGKRGADELHGDDGNDEIVGNEGADLIFGGDGNDIIGAGKGDDVVFGGPGDDMIDGKRGADELHGDDGNDEIVGNEDADLIFGGDGNDIIGGGQDDDVLHGDDGVDTIDGKAGTDTCNGGETNLNCEIVG